MESHKNSHKVTTGQIGAATVPAALINLGAQAFTDNFLLTNSKTIVGEINELYKMTTN